ncbi:hypothetical protein [Ralstonia pseudosolanacearum]|uniref:hypothetical protein n=1 Tax=Ralstonia pseudosolanacearum TaxID=1310165 RepID=UPI0002C10E39|nr:hypothetical protein [Ralstonia pseudosolanacearum]AGH85384.1 hypothetical protein F504_2873 [Ralstonia pseudosolanacearum FQY_4]ANH31792.1 hypothetical protein A3768_0615 [Ralstonia solanacearum]
MPKPKTNIEFVRDLMGFSRFEPLAQMFVIDALSKWSEKIAKTPIEELRKAFDGNPLIGAEAWQGVACEIKEKLDAHFAQRNCHAQLPCHDR